MVSNKRLALFSHHPLLKFMLVLSVLLGVVVVLGCQKSFADSFYSISPANNGPGNVPASVLSNANSQCIAIANSVGSLYPIGQVQWLSAPGQPTNQAISAAAGSTATLQWNVATYFCDYSGQTYGGVTYRGYYSTSPGNAVPTYAVVSVSSSPAGLTTSGLLYKNTGINSVSVTPNTANIWTVNSKTFTITVPSSSGTITLSENDKVINTFPAASSAVAQGGQYECVGAKPGGPYDYNHGYFRINNFDFFGVNPYPTGPENSPTSSTTPPACGNYPTSLTAQVTIVSNNIQGRVVNQANGQGVPNVPIYDCDGSQVTKTDSTGNYYFSEVPGNGFCLRPQSFSYVASDGNTYPISSGQLYDRPWGFNYGDPASRCPSYGATSPPYAGNCSPINNPPVVIESNQTYECQVAGNNAAQPCPGTPSNNTWVYSGGGNGYDFVFNFTPPAPAGACPNWQAQGNEPAGFPSNVNVTLLNTPQPTAPGGAASGTTGQSGSTTTANQQYYQYTPQTEFRINSAVDQYPAPNNDAPSTAAWGTWQASASFTLDYSHFYNNYPYDPHTVTINYDQDWTQVHWYTSSTPDSGDCRSNGSGGYDSFGYIDGGYYCYYSDSKFSPPACWSGASPADYGPDASGYCYYAPSAYNYNWHFDPSTTVVGHNPSDTTDAPAMPACYDRTFQVTQVGASASLNGAAEDPTTGTTQGSVNVTFGYPASGPQGVQLRNPMQVKLSYDRAVTGCNAGPSTSTGNTATITGLYAPSTGSGNLDPSPGFQCAFTAPPHVAGDQLCVTYTVYPTGTQMDWQGNVTVNNGLSMQNSPAVVCSAQLTNEPYAHFMGGDVSAGGAFANGGDACASGNPLAAANIAGFVEDGQPLTRGSGTQFAALANGSITTFGSAIMRPGTNYPVAQNGLSFANSPTLGGLNMPLCEPDYYSTLPAGAAAAGSPLDISSFNGSPPPAGPPIITDETYTGNLTINGVNMPVGGGIGPGIGDGNRVAIYVNGNVYIKNNIVFKSRQSGWTSTSSIPSFYLIVKGNIYLDPSVSELDGVYIAQPNGGTGGVINTCSPGFAAPGYTYAAANLFSNCQSQLTVNGAFIASNVELYRTYASLRNSLGGEYPAGAVSPDNCTAGDHGSVNRASTATSYDCGAEVFNLTPDILLGQPAINANATIDDGKFDFITSLSPVL